MSDNTNRPGAVNTTPLPPPVPLTGLDCYIDPKDGKVKRYEQARADLEAENKRLREALEAILDEQNDNEGYAKPATYDAAYAALEFVARHKSSDWPERCQQMVDMARAALKDTK